MTFLYFAYGSNMWPPQLCSRCASARSLGRGTVDDWRFAYDKPGADGTAKANLRPAPGSKVEGVVYELETSDRPALDRAEPGYTPLEVEVMLPDGDVVEALTYQWESQGTDVLPADWYMSMVVSGATSHGLSTSYISSSVESESQSEPGLAGLTAVGAEELPALQGILSSAMSPRVDRYTIHPGDLAWWMWHDDPRHVNLDSYWMIPDRVVLVIDSARNEVSVLAVPGVDRIPVAEWAQRRLRGEAEVGFIADSDIEMVGYLEGNGCEPVHVDRWYQWDLERVEVPEPVVPTGWVIRPLMGETEADERRRASHAAFKSTMDPVEHLERYLKFMRSPVYDLSRDLVVVSPEGRIVSFMFWWPDRSGIAQIEPFGTHPDFQRRGLGRALIHYGLRRMRDAGMKLTRVVTDEPRSDATGFYQSVGFDDVGRLRWWRRKA